MPRDAYEVKVEGFMWGWDVTYPDGIKTSNELRVPVGIPVKVSLTSRDVLHAFFIPEYRVQEEAIPGRTTYFWFKPTRPPGMTWGRLNLAVWGILGAFIIQLFGIPVLAGAVTLLLFDKYLGTNFYNAAMGGSAMLYQHLFWFYAHPAVYVIALPAFGIVSEIVSTFSRKKIFGYTSMAIALMIITFLGFDVWIHHLFTKGVEDWARIVQSLLTILIGVPTGIKVFNWLATMHKGSIEFKAPMLYAVGFITLFVIGGVTGVGNGLLAVDLHVHDTYWIVAHFHMILSLAMTTVAFAGIYFWFPKFTGRMYNERMAKISFWFIMIGALIAFMPLFKVGLEGMPSSKAIEVMREG